MSPEMKYLLECEMATYERLCSVKRTPKSELDRHQSIIRNAFAGFAGISKSTPRVDRILNETAPVETLLPTYLELDKYFQKHRKSQ